MGHYKACYQDLEEYLKSRTVLEGYKKTYHIQPSDHPPGVFEEEKQADKKPERFNAKAYQEYAQDYRPFLGVDILLELQSEVEKVCSFSTKEKLGTYIEQFKIRINAFDAQEKALTERLGSLGMAKEDYEKETYPALKEKQRAEKEQKVLSLLRGKKAQKVLALLEAKTPEEASLWLLSSALSAFMEYPLGDRSTSLFQYCFSLSKDETATWKFLLQGYAGLELSHAEEAGQPLFPVVDKALVWHQACLLAQKLQKWPDALRYAARAYAVSCQMEDKAYYHQLYQKQDLTKKDKRAWFAQLLSAQTARNGRIRELLEEHAFEKLLQVEEIQAQNKPLMAYLLGRDFKELFWANSTSAHAASDRETLGFLWEETQIPSAFKVEALNLYLDSYPLQKLFLQDMGFYLRQALCELMSGPDGSLVRKNQYIDAMVLLEGLTKEEVTSRFNACLSLREALKQEGGESLQEKTLEALQRAVLQWDGIKPFEDIMQQVDAQLQAPLSLRWTPPLAVLPTPAVPDFYADIQGERLAFQCSLLRPDGHCGFEGLAHLLGLDGVQAARDAFRDSLLESRDVPFVKESLLQEMRTALLEAKGEEGLGIKGADALHERYYAQHAAREQALGEFRDQTPGLAGCKDEAVVAYLREHREQHTALLQMLELGHDAAIATTQQEILDFCSDEEIRTQYIQGFGQQRWLGMPLALWFAQQRGIDLIILSRTEAEGGKDLQVCAQLPVEHRQAGYPKKYFIYKPGHYDLLEKHTPLRLALESKEESKEEESKEEEAASSKSAVSVRLDGTTHPMTFYEAQEGEPLIPANNPRQQFFLWQGGEAKDSGFDALKTSRPAFVFECLRLLKSTDPKGRSTPQAMNLQELLSKAYGELLLSGALDELATVPDLLERQNYEDAQALHRQQEESIAAKQDKREKGLKDLQDRGDSLVQKERASRDLQELLKERALRKENYSRAQTTFSQHCSTPKTLERFVKFYLGEDGPLPLSLALWYAGFSKKLCEFWVEGEVSGQVRALSEPAEEKVQAEGSETKGIILVRGKGSQYVPMSVVKEGCNPQVFNEQSQRRARMLGLYLASLQYVQSSLLNGYLGEGSVYTGRVRYFAQLLLGDLNEEQSYALFKEKVFFAQEKPGVVCWEHPQLGVLLSFHERFRERSAYDRVTDLTYLCHQVVNELVHFAFSLPQRSKDYAQVLEEERGYREGLERLNQYPVFKPAWGYWGWTEDWYRDKQKEAQGKRHHLSVGLADEVGGLGNEEQFAAFLRIQGRLVALGKQEGPLAYLGWYRLSQDDYRQTLRRRSMQEDLQRVMGTQMPLDVRTLDVRTLLELMQQESGHQPRQLDLRQGAFPKALADNFYKLFCKEVEQIIANPDSTLELIQSIMQASFGTQNLEYLDGHAKLAQLSLTPNQDELVYQLVERDLSMEKDGQARLQARLPRVQNAARVVTHHYLRQMALIKPQDREKFTRFLVQMMFLYFYWPEKYGKSETPINLLDWLDTGPQLMCLGATRYSRSLPYEGPDIELTTIAGKVSCLSLIRKSGFLCETLPLEGEKEGELVYFAFRARHLPIPASEKYDFKLATEEQVRRFKDKILDASARYPWYPSEQEVLWLDEKTLTSHKYAVRDYRAIPNQYLPGEMEAQNASAPSTEEKIKQLRAEMETARAADRADMEARRAAEMAEIEARRAIDEAEKEVIKAVGKAEMEERGAANEERRAADLAKLAAHKVELGQALNLPLLQQSAEQSLKEATEAQQEAEKVREGAKNAREEANKAQARLEELKKAYEQRFQSTQEEQPFARPRFFKKKQGQGSGEEERKESHNTPP